MEEIFRDIEGYNGSYQVSNLGRVKSFKNGHEKILKQGISSVGYLYVILCQDGTATTSRVHRLVAETFIPNTENKPQVNHKDGCKTNNCITNPEWCTCSENVKHAFLNGLSESVRKAGAENGRKYSSIPVVQLTKNREFVEEFPSAHEACRHVGIDYRSINACCRAKIKYAGNFIWMYKN